MKYEIEFPPLVKNGVEYEPTGEFRKARPGEFWLSSDPSVEESKIGTTGHYHILRREPTPLEKLESLCRRIIDGNDEKLNAELDACIAAVKGAK